MSVTKPILRIFDYDKTFEFYVNWLGFKIDWESKEEGVPVYMQVSLGDIVFYLSEHHGDSVPGVKIFIDEFKELILFHKMLLDKKYKYNRPGIHTPFYDDNALEVNVLDPFGNKLTFVERNINLK